MGDGNNILEGIVVSGSGEGSFFMSLEPYIEAMKENLGFIPFQGTFNIKVNKQQAQNFLESLALTTIDGFQKGTKKFGNVKCYKCKLKQTECAIIIPEFTRYDLDVVELISEFNLREKFNLKDGDKIQISLK